MRAYTVVLFVHIAAAVLLVGGSSWTHAAGVLLRRARTVDGARSHVAFLQTFVKASMPLAVVTLLAGAYMATDAGMWDEAWLITSLVLFLGVGAAAGTIVDPAVAAMAATLDEAPPGPVTPALLERIHDPRLTATLSLFAGADLALLFLMTNKPGVTGSLLVAATGLVLGGIHAARERRGQRPAAGAGAAPA